MAGIYIEQLGDPGAAFLVLQSAFTTDPTSRAIADGMDYAAHLTDNWSQLIDTYVVAAGKLDRIDGDSASALWLRVACANIVSTSDWDAVSDAVDRVRAVDVEWAAAYLDMVERIESPDVLTSLGKLAARIEDWERMARVLSRAVSIQPDPVLRAPLHFQIAEFNRAMGDLSTAEWHYVETLRLDDSSNDARTQLVAIYKSRGDFRKAAELLEQARRNAEKPGRPGEPRL